MLVPCRLRPCDRADEPFVFSAWLRHDAHNRDPALADLVDKEFFGIMHRRVEAILAAGRVLMACSETDPDCLYGFVARAEDGAVVKIYVKQHLRNMGIEARLEVGK